MLPGVSNTRKPNPARRSERSRRAVLAAARELVSELGYAKVTIEAIAARAGVGKQTIYRWWPSKGAVIFDSFLALSEGGEGIRLPDTGDLEADLKTVMRATVAEFADPVFEAPLRALNTEIVGDPALAALYREKLAGPVDQAKKERLRSAQRAGQLAADADLDLVLEVLYAPLYQRWLHRSGPLTPEYADALVDITLRAFAP
ncbi:DNA-binding transcriptional regulator, AcrR family [Thermomonospora echinospora]|uniref:DNA-binding transcriptional regulator, AcrR family n=1 Tax=Thermomonospora echinospora TaxID=1992 RepID=A0A1H6E0A9_9ACTN|nr:DNA-binding transcriptional regulator, AcrR family [Thermomonospora echinospora]